MKNTLEEIFYYSYNHIFREFKDSEILFKSSYTNLEKILKSNHISVESGFFYKKIRDGWFLNYEPAQQRSINAKFESLTFAEFIALFHPDRPTRLLLDKLRRKLDLNVTAICNYECEYCYQRSRDTDWEKLVRKAQYYELSIDELKKIIDQAAILGSGSIKITGGEPLTKKGVISLVKYALSKESLNEVELLSNSSLITEHLQELKEITLHKANKFHLHSSIDGLSTEKGLSNTKYSKIHYKKLINIRKELPGIKISINSMWTENLCSKKVLNKIYQFAIENKVDRWTISFPYIVDELKNALKRNHKYIPDYEKVVKLTYYLVKIHRDKGYPFQLSIPLLFKHEMFDKGYTVATQCFDNHPCFPCHGSYLIIGPKGEIMECLLAKPQTNANIKDGDLLEVMLQSIKENSFYDLTEEIVSNKCNNCRYEHLCQGQCVNDRAIKKNNPFAPDTEYGQDNSACNLLSRAEVTIWPLLDRKNKKIISTYINKNGFYPLQNKSIDQIINKFD